MWGQERCHYPGSMSHGTRGEGPWWCNQHFFCGDSDRGARIVMESRGWRVGDPIARAKKIVPPQPKQAEAA